MSYPTSPPGKADTQHNDDDDSLPPTGGSSPSLPVGRTSVGEHSWWMSAKVAHIRGECRSHSRRMSNQGELWTIML